MTDSRTADAPGDRSRDDWAGEVLQDYTLTGGIYLVSEPQNFDGGEEEYDLHIGGAHREDLAKSGQGAWELIKHYATRDIDVLLEIGAGGGTCSLGLVQAAGETNLIVTDTSPQFLRIVGRKLTAAGLDQTRVRFATLAGEDLNRLATASVDAVVIASALHHVGDWAEFLRQSARILRPGGVLAIQEPFREGNLMMAMGLDIALSPLWPAKAALSDDDRGRLERCRDSIYFLANSHITKIGEDKHSFLLSDLTTAAQKAGFAATMFYSNVHFEDLANADLGARTGGCSFLNYMDSFLEHHHRISADGMNKLRSHLFPVFQTLDDRFRGGDGAPLLGCMVFRR